MTTTITRTRRRLVHLDAPARLTALGRDEFEGYASLFGVPDSAGDVVAPGAFTQSLRTRGVRRVRLLYQHFAHEPIGVWEVNYLQATGSASGAGTATLAAAGTDSNIDIALAPKGTGAVRMATVANGSVATALSSIGPTGAHTTVQEWFAIKNASGVVRYIPGF
jgi:HK97 family phage prohead protease